jgi:RNA polymerase primary sigma factor
MVTEFGIKLDNETDLISDIALEDNIKSANLYDWQRRAIKFFYDSNGKAVFNCATGTGKTRFALELLKLLLKEDDNYRVLVVVPKNVIMETGWYVEFYNNGFKLQDIGVFYGAIKEVCKITITNIQNIDKIPLELFDIAILDEIHNYGTKRALQYIQHDFKYKIGLSATIERLDGKHWDIMKCFNYNLFKYGAKEALQDDILNKFYFFNIAVEMDENSFDDYTELTKKLNLIMIQGGGFEKIMKHNDGTKAKMLSLMNERKQLVNNYNRKFDVIRTICKKHINDKIIIFSQFNEQTNKYYWNLLDIGIRAYIIHSGVDKDKINNILSQVKRDNSFCIVTSKMLDEGWNLPRLDVAIITAGDSTDRQIIQRMGRVLRKKDVPSYLYQVYCDNTIEEQQGIKRAKIFKELCSDYREYIHYNGEENFVFEDI